MFWQIDIGVLTANFICQTATDKPHLYKKNKFCKYLSDFRYYIFNKASINKLISIYKLLLMGETNNTVTHLCKQIHFDR